jgi:hypothetical protein
MAGPGAEASPDATVNDTGDTDSRNGVITLREAMMLATGDLSLIQMTTPLRLVSVVSRGENQVSSCGVST